MPISANTNETLYVKHNVTKDNEDHQATSENREEDNFLSRECKELLLSLPREKGWRTPYIYHFQGFWCQPKEIQAIINFQRDFRARDTDVLLATVPKSGTTWLKALAFAVVNRNRFPISSNNSNNNHPLLSSNPHDLVPFFEYKVYANNQLVSADLSRLHDEPRMFATHVPFASLQESIKKSNCRIVYICRNPLDTFISSWHYINKLRPKSQPPLEFEDAFNMYCKGVVGFGPFWDHMLGYWKESLDRPDKVLFLKYEDLKEDVTFHLKNLAKFLGCPFSVEEERGGVIEETAKLCSFEKLKDLEVNKSGKSIMNFENKHLFRNGEVGDWINYFSPSMVKQLCHVMEEKLCGSGLEFKIFP